MGKHGRNKDKQYIMVIELSPIRVIDKLRGSLIWFGLYNHEKSARAMERPVLLHFVFIKTA